MKGSENWVIESFDDCPAPQEAIDNLNDILVKWLARSIILDISYHKKSEIYVEDLGEVKV